jgi:hypothetical protein
MTQTTRTVRYEGPPTRVSMLAQMLEEEGVTVDYEPPPEYRDVTAIAATVVISLVCSGLYDGIKAGVNKARQKFGDHAKVTIEGEDD